MWHLFSPNSLMIWHPQMLSARATTLISCLQCRLQKHHCSQKQKSFFQVIQILPSNLYLPSAQAMCSAVNTECSCLCGDDLVWSVLFRPNISYIFESNLFMYLSECLRRSIVLKTRADQRMTIPCHHNFSGFEICLCSALERKQNLSNIFTNQHFLKTTLSAREGPGFWFCMLSVQTEGTRALWTSEIFQTQTQSKSIHLQVKLQLLFYASNMKEDMSS